MARACHTSVRMATGEAFSDEEIDDILDRLARRHERLKGEAATGEQQDAWAGATRDMTREALEEALQKRRLQVFAEQAKTARAPMLASLPGDEGDKLRAYNVGTERQGAFSGFSVDADGRARATGLWGDVERGVRAIPGLMDRVSDFFGRGDADFEDRVAQEMGRLNGSTEEATGDAMAEDAAKVFAASLENARRMQNDQGAFIRRLPGYIARQAHDRLKVSGGFWREVGAGGIGALGDWRGAALKASQRAFREWRDHIRPRLDPSTFAGIEHEDIPNHRLEDFAEEKRQMGRKADLQEAAALHAAGVIDDPNDLEERFLFHVWFDIVAGKLDTLSGADDLGDFRPPASTARSVSKARVLHFTSSKAWMEYHRKFGRGSLFSVVMSQLERAGRNTALMSRWGPAPQAAFDAEVQRLATAARGRGEARAAEKVQAHMRQVELDELTGAANRPENLRLAIVARTIRADQVMAKLGGMVLSALSDTALASQAMARAGAGFLDGYQGAFKGIARLQSEDGKRAADLLDVGARSTASHLTGRFVSTDGPLGWSAWAQRLFYRVNGFEAWNDGLRRGVAEMLSAHLGEQSDKAWEAIHPGTRETLERFGIDEHGWNLVRQGVTPLSDGRKYFSFDAVDHINDRELNQWAGFEGDKATDRTASNAREELRIRLQAMVGNVLDDAVTEPRAREKAGLHRGLRPGTIMGEAVRMLTQFWSFNQALIGRHLVPAARGHSGRVPAALLAHLIVASTAMGYASLQAKQLTKGRSPRPLGLDTLTASLLQGGGLGIYGDFLFGEYNRNGQAATLSSFMGPSVAETERLMQILRMGVHGDLQDMPAELVRFGASNAPFVNLWYARLALDYTILWRLQEAASPGYLRRYEDRVKQQEHTSFIVPPSVVAH